MAYYDKAVVKAVHRASKYFLRGCTTVEQHKAKPRVLYTTLKLPCHQSVVHEQTRGVFSRLRNMNEGPTNRDCFSLS